MACKLNRRPSDGVFVGRIGQTVEVNVESDRPARAVRIAYAGDQDGDAPFTFRIKPGRSKLLLVALGVKNDQKMFAVEVDGANICPLKGFFWSKTHFHTTLDIEGV